MVKNFVNRLVSFIKENEKDFVFFFPTLIFVMAVAEDVYLTYSYYLSDNGFISILSMAMHKYAIMGHLEWNHSFSFVLYFVSITFSHFVSPAILITTIQIISFIVVVFIIYKLNIKKKITTSMSFMLISFFLFSPLTTNTNLVLYDTVVWGFPALFLLGMSLIENKEKKSIIFLAVLFLFDLNYVYIGFSLALYIILIEKNNLFAGKIFALTVVTFLIGLFLGGLSVVDTLNHFKTVSYQSLLRDTVFWSLLITSGIFFLLSFYLKRKEKIAMLSKSSFFLFLSCPYILLYFLSVGKQEYFVMVVLLLGILHIFYRYREVHLNKTVLTVFSLLFLFSNMGSISSYFYREKIPSYLYGKKYEALLERKEFSDKYVDILNDKKGAVIVTHYPYDIHLGASNNEVYTFSEIKGRVDEFKDREVYVLLPSPNYLNNEDFNKIYGNKEFVAHLKVQEEIMTSNSYFLLLKMN